MAYFYKMNMLKKIFIHTNLIIFSFFFFLPEYQDSGFNPAWKTLVFADSISSQDQYTVGVSDVLKIVVYDEPKLSNNRATVSMDGYVSFGLIGRVKVEGLTVNEIEEKVGRLLKDGYILNPEVSATVVEYLSRKVFVLGAVNKPGTYELRGKTTLLEIISRAEGFTEGKDSNQPGDKILIIRKNKKGRDILSVNRKSLMRGEDTSSDIFLQNNDTIFVPVADFIYVFGEIKNPGSYKLNEESKTLLSAITMAGGFTEYASPRKTKIVRIVNGKEKTIYVNVDDITKRGIKSKDIKLKSEDVIIVPEGLF